MDLVVYSEHMDIEDKTKEFIEDTWHRIKNEYTHYIYFPIEFDSVDDGVRSISEEWRNNVDKEFKKMLGGVKSYLTVTGSPMQRVEQVLNYIK